MSKNNDIEEKYPSNSKTERKKVEKGKVINTTAKKRKKTWLERLKGHFVGDDMDSVSSYVIQDVLIPAAKNTISDLITGSIDMIFYGEKGVSTRGRSHRGSRTGSYVSYNKPSRGISRHKPTRARVAHEFDDITFPTKGDAEDVLGYLVDLTIDEGFASVADFYRAIGMTGEYTDENYGWTRLNTARIRRVTGREGTMYVIAFPRTEEI